MLHEMRRARQWPPCGITDTSNTAESKNQKIAVGVLPRFMRPKIAEAPGIECFVIRDGSQSSTAGEQCRAVHYEFETMVVRLIHDNQLQTLKVLQDFRWGCKWD